jgi:class 3 adenylate cyclase
MATDAAFLESQVEEILNTKWDVTETKQVPESSEIVLKNGAKKLTAAFLYADLAGSTVLAQVCPWETTAKIIRAYLDASVRLIRAWGGHVRSFDGDRVMGIFVGDYPASHASFCAREIDHTVTNILNPKAKTKFKSIRDNDIMIKHCIGIDYGDSRAVRAGIRNNNDIIWIGKPPSFAAKLSDIREYPFEVYISSRVHNRLTDSARKPSGSSIWESRTFTFAGSTETVYRTKTTKTP